MPGEDFHLSDLARFQAHPRTPAACEDLAISLLPGVARFALTPGYIPCTAPRCPRANT